MSQFDDLNPAKTKGLKALVAVDPYPDPIWLSLIRGRILAVIAAAIALITTFTELIPMIRDLGDGVTVNEVTGTATQFGQLLDATGVFIIAVSSAVAMIAALISKFRETLREKKRNA